MDLLYPNTFRTNNLSSSTRKGPGQLNPLHKLSEEQATNNRLCRDCTRNRYRDTNIEM